PLPITDLVIRPQDGALYFLTGGRNTSSALYRVAYNGSEPTDSADCHEPKGAKAREEQRSLARFHRGEDTEAINTLWTSLGHSDRALRYSARVALEHQPVTNWQNRALTEPRPRARLTAMMALARCGPSALRPRILKVLGE